MYAIYALLLLMQMCILEAAALSACQKTYFSSNLIQNRWIMQNMYA